MTFSMPQMIAKIATMAIFYRPFQGVKGFDRFKVVQAPKKKKSKKVRELVGRATCTDVSGPILGYFGVRKSMANE